MAADRHQVAARWSRNNPVDCAGGETRDTIPEVLEMITAHPDVHAVDLSRPRDPEQPGAADAARAGSIPSTASSGSSTYHERQDQRFAEAADELSRRYDKPILTATELAVADPDEPRPGRGSRHRDGCATPAATGP